jgi:hypothetical protein
MEVHHHAHHPKKISEYLTEFIMLFAAVTLGFFAENLREHQIEKHREIQYLKNIHLDLKRDISEIDKISHYNVEKQQLGQQLAQLYARGYQNDLPQFYMLIKSLALRSYFQHSNNGIDQLKNAGGLRLVEDDEIIKQMQLLEIRIANIEALQQSMDQNLLYFRMKTGMILNASTVWEMNETQNLQQSPNSATRQRRFSLPSHVLPLQMKDPASINELVNLGIAPVNTTRYINNHLAQLKKQCIQLNKRLIEKYGSEF